MNAEWVALLLIQKFQVLLLDGEATVTNPKLRNQVQEATNRLNLLHQSLKVSRNKEQAKRHLHDGCNNIIFGSSLQDGTIQNPRNEGTRRVSSSYLEAGKDVVDLGDQAKDLEEHLICTNEMIQLLLMKFL